jgi:stage III sporulation protein AD
MSGGVFGRILLVAAVAALTAQFLRGKTPALALLMSLAGLLVLFGLLLPGLQTLWRQFRQLLAQSGLDLQLFLPLLKVLALTQITRISAELCRDAGERALAAKLELCGGTASLLCLLPLAQQALALMGALGT